MNAPMRHAVYSALNKPRLLMGVDFRIFLIAGASGLPILAFSHGRFTLIAAFGLPVMVFSAGAALYRRDPRFVDTWRACRGLGRQLDASKWGQPR